MTRPPGPASTSTSNRSDCEKCRGIGYVRYNVPLGHEFYGKAIPCTCTAEARAKRSESALWTDAGVPGRYGDYTFADYVRMAGDDPGKREVVEVLKTYGSLGYIPNKSRPDRPYAGILLYGEPGVGKTGALAPLFSRYVRAGNGGLWLQYNQFLSDMKRFSDEGGARRIEDRKRQCQTIPYLFLDDLGDPDRRKPETDYANDVLFEVVDYRVNRDLPMFITTNLNPGGFGEHFRSRLFRRIAEVCAVVEVSGSQLLEGYSNDR